MSEAERWLWIIALVAQLLLVFLGTWSLLGLRGSGPGVDTVKIAGLYLKADTL